MRLAASILLAAFAAGATGCSVANHSTGVGDVSGTHLGVFATDRNQSAGQYDIVLWDYDALKFIAVPQLNSTAAERHPSISSDGRFIAFQVDRGGGGLDDIYVYDRLHPGYVDTPGINTAGEETEPAFTGDGLKLCFAQTGTSTPQRRIRLYDGQTKSLIPLPGLDTTGVIYSDYGPAPNRDGSLIAFVSDRSGRPHVYLYDRLSHQVLDGPKLRTALVSVGADDVDPSFTSDGRFLVFASTRAVAGSKGGFDLYMVEFTSVPIDTVLRDLSPANSVYDDRSPAVSQNGDIVVFQSNRVGGTGGWDVWNYKRSTGGAPGFYAGYNSTGDDIEPSIRWPN